MVQSPLLGVWEAAAAAPPAALHSWKAAPRPAAAGTPQHRGWKRVCLRLLQSTQLCVRCMLRARSAAALAAPAAAAAQVQEGRP